MTCRARLMMPGLILLRARCRYNRVHYYVNIKYMYDQNHTSFTSRPLVGMQQRRHRSGRRACANSRDIIRVLLHYPRSQIAPLVSSRRSSKM